MLRAAKPTPKSPPRHRNAFDYVKHAFHQVGEEAYEAASHLFPQIRGWLTAGLKEANDAELEEYGLDKATIRRARRAHKNGYAGPTLDYQLELMQRNMGAPVEE